MIWKDQNKIDLTNNPDKQLEGRVKEAFKDAEKLLHKTSEGTLADMDKRLRDHLNFKLNKIWENFVTNADKIFEETMEGISEKVQEDMTGTSADRNPSNLSWSETSNCNPVHSPA